MDKNDFADVLNNLKDLTLGQIIRIALKLKYRTVAMIVLFFVTIIGSAFVAGKYTQQKETAVMLESPFAMRVELDNKNYDFEKLTLMRDPLIPPPAEDQVVLSIREIKSAFDIIPVGKIVAQVEETKLSGIWKVIISKRDIINEAHARIYNDFDWNGHENDYKFKEKFVNKNTVHRYYFDGCILEYKVDNKRRSIPNSFKWVVKEH